VSVGGGKEIVDFHFNRGDRALASEVPIECHAYSHVGYGSGDASVSHSGAVGQFVAQRALDGDAVAVGAGEFYSKQGIEWNSREEITNLFGCELAGFHCEEIQLSVVSSRLSVGAFEEGGCALASTYAHGYYAEA